MPKDRAFQRAPNPMAEGFEAMRKVRSGGEKPNDSKRRHLTPDEARALIDAAGRVGRQPHRDKILCMVLYRHGLRVGEAVALQWSQFALDGTRDRTLHVARLKGSKASTHSLEPDEVNLLRKLKAETDSKFVFVSERGGPMSVDAVQVIVKRAGELAGLPFQAHPHMLRHACGYSLANEGTDTRLIQEYLGHVDIRHTAHYTAISPARLRSVRVR